jgi:hypothetical protein
MSDLRRAHCLTCGKSRYEVGEISWQGNCRDCGQLRLAENIIGIATQTGPGYRRWKSGMLKWAATLEPDRLEATG